MVRRKKYKLKLRTRKRKRKVIKKGGALVGPGPNPLGDTTPEPPRDQIVPDRDTGPYVYHDKWGNVGHKVSILSNADSFTKTINDLYGKAFDLGSMAGGIPELNAIHEWVGIGSMVPEALDGSLLHNDFNVPTKVSEVFGIENIAKSATEGIFGLPDKVKLQKTPPTGTSTTTQPTQETRYTIGNITIGHAPRATISNVTTGKMPESDLDKMTNIIDNHTENFNDWTDSVPDTKLEETNDYIPGSYTPITRKSTARKSFDQTIRESKHREKKIEQSKKKAARLHKKYLKIRETM